MSDWMLIIAYTLASGAAIPVGGGLASIERFRPDWLDQEFRHGVIAFGGGVLLSAVALVLVPEGVRNLPPLWANAAALLGGGLAFFTLDLLLAKSRTSGAQLAAMLADFLPEAMALGAVMAGDDTMGLLLAILIGMQNLPEGFNAYRELVASGMHGRRVLRLFTMLALLGPIVGLTGYYALASHPAATGVIMLAASGGILYLMFQDIAVQAKLERHWLPALGAVLGFLAGLIGQQAVH